MSSKKGFSAQKKLEKIEQQYFTARIQALAKDYGMEIKEQRTAYPHGWQGVFAFDAAPALDGTIKDYLFCYKPLQGPYVEFSLWLFIEDVVFKEHIQGIMAIISKHGVCLSLDYSPKDNENHLVNAQLTLRVFTANFVNEVFDCVLDNLISCKKSLMQYLIDLGIEVGLPPFGERESHIE